MPDRTMLDRYTHQVEQFYISANRRTCGWISVFMRAWNRFNLNHANESTAGIAFFSIISVIPLLVFVIFTVSALITSSVILKSVENFLTSAFPVSLAGLMNVIYPLTGENDSLDLIAILGFLWVASNMFNFILYSVNRSWNSRSSRGFVKNRLLALAFVTGLAVLVVLLFILLFYIRLIAGLLPGIGNRMITLILPLLIQTSLIFGSPGFAVKKAGFWGVSVHTHTYTPKSGYPPRKFPKNLIFLIYKFGPATTVNTRAVLMGAILATIAIEIITRSFTWYLNSRWSTYTTFYGPLGALIGLLFWVFLSDWILLFGSYLSEAIHKRWDSDRPNEFFEPLVFSIPRFGF